MSQYLILSHIEVQNANSVAGFTWGFPAITQFLGFTHALSRKLSQSHGGEYETVLTGCAVISHHHQNKVYQPKRFADFEFLQSKNPPVLAKHKNSSPPIIEEGKVNLDVSLIIELSELLSLTTEQIQFFEQTVSKLSQRMRVAGGSVLNIGQVKLLSANTQDQYKKMVKRIKLLTMPGFILIDRSDYLAKHYEHLAEQDEQQSELLNAWLDFSAMKYRAEPQLEKGQTIPDEDTDATWHYIPKADSGYLVPLMVGYKAISDINPPGKVGGVRDPSIPSCFVEAVHSVGEWQSLHRVNHIEKVVWRYRQQDAWYLCQQEQTYIQGSEKTDETESLQINDIEQALNLF